MAKLNILYLTHRVPYPPNRGDRIRSFHQLDYLASRADVSLAALADEPVPEATRAELERRCAQLAIEPVGRYSRWCRAAASAVQGRTMTAGLFASARLRRTIRRWAGAKRFDAVLVFCSSMLQYAMLPELACARKVIDLVDVDSEKWFDYHRRARGFKRLAYGLEGRQVRRLERSLLERMDAVVLVSEAEAALFRSVCPNDRTWAVTNGVDFDYFTPSDLQSEQPERCVFVGVLDYGANVDGLEWFCRQVWPRVKSQAPRATFAVVGRRPTAAVRKVADGRGVELVGEVPDVRPHLREASVVVAPLRIARGIQNKVLEAMAMGKAVLASPEALEGIAARPGLHLAQAGAASDWIEQLTALFTDPVRRTELGARGRAFVQEHHSWQACLEPLSELLGLERPGRGDASSTPRIGPAYCEHQPLAREGERPGA